MPLTLLLTADELRAFRPLSATLDATARLEPYLREAQHVDLRPILGEALYADLIANSADAKYVTLLDGETYTNPAGNSQRFEGIKPLLAYYAYARFVAFQGVHVTPHGVVRRSGDHSEPVADGTRQRLETQARAMATAYLEGLRDFLDANPTDYPLWSSCQTSKNPKGSIQINAIG